jgi:LacI family transcriptional regulator, gluconate utilization system Gnt-I transcriptional repressor
MEDVARRAGVAKITVSRYVREPKTVASKTALRIKKAIQEVGYIPNFIAGGLSSNRSRIVAAVMPTITNPMLARMLSAIFDELQGSGLYLMLGNCGGTLAEEEEVIRTLVAQRPAGFVLHAVRHSMETKRMLKTLGIPSVETGDLLAEPLDMAVSYSNYDATKTMIHHLCKRGYQKIAFVSMPLQPANQVGERVRGYKAALKEVGRPIVPDYIYETPLSFRGGADAIANLLERRPEIDAAFFAGDILAAGALFECQRQNWAVPGRVAIAGFDNYDIALQCVPALTTVDVRREEIGRRAAEMLIKRLRGESVEETRVNVGFQLIERAST